MVAGDADGQGHHLIIPFEQPFANGMSQCRSSFYASFFIFANKFVLELEQHRALAPISHSEDALECSLESNFR